MPSKYRLVFDDLETAFSTSNNPAVRDLSFGLTFPAESQEQAEQFVSEAAEMQRLGRWHIEPVEEMPRAE